MWYMHAWNTSKLKKTTDTHNNVNGSQMHYTK